ncbi:MAG: SPASM domain-containing protein [bacterium]|nr:MAG: SPASM domain-containing protein [bacterium]
MTSNLKEKMTAMFIPAPLLISARRIGLRRLFSMLFAIGFSYTGVVWYLLRRRGPAAAWKFISVKLFTPVGPGGVGVWWFFAGWFIRRFPQLYGMPKQLEMEITTTCAKRCIHCEHTYWSRESQPIKQMTYEQVIGILEQFPGLRWASLVGEGSSFEHKEMKRFITYLRRRNIMSYVPDHMCDYDDETIEHIVSNDMDGIVLSFDGASRETYESIKVGCRYDRTIENIRKVLAAKKRLGTPFPEIMFAYIAMKNNVHEIPDFVDLVGNIGRRAEFGAGSRIGIIRLLAFKQILDLQLEDIPGEIIEETYRRAAKHGMLVNFTGTNVREDLPEPTCCMAWMEPYIMMEGYVSQCCAVFISNNRDFIREHAHGNVLKENFRDIWYNRSYKTLRYTINNPGKPIPMQCAGCRIFNTLPREKQYGIIDTQTGEVMSLKTFYEEHMGENMKWRYEDVDLG